ncbi:MAG: hypothetical protein V4702_03485 [Patescibacteria group bacterium]
MLDRANPNLSPADQNPVRPDQLSVAYAWHGDCVEIGRLVVGDTNLRPAESERWEAYFSRRRENPLTVIKACEYRGPIRGLALFERLRGIRATIGHTLREMYIKPPDALQGQAERIAYTHEVGVLLLNEADLCLAAIGVTPLPHDPELPQVWPYGRPEQIS